MTVFVSGNQEDDQKKKNDNGDQNMRKIKKVKISPIMILSGVSIFGATVYLLFKYFK